jgi:predicted nuclease of restriction endonuclease-like (RecB) superfamily
VTVKVKQLQTKPNETESKASKGASVKGLKKLIIFVLHKRNLKSIGLNGWMTETLGGRHCTAV